MFTMKEGRVEAARQGIENGVALRVLVNGAWGFASVGSLDATVLSEAIGDACGMAKAASLRMKIPIKLAKAPVVEDHVKVTSEEEPCGGQHRRQNRNCRANHEGRDEFG